MPQTMVLRLGIILLSVVFSSHLGREKTTPIAKSQIAEQSRSFAMKTFRVFFAICPQCIMADLRLFS